MRFLLTARPKVCPSRPSRAILGGRYGVSRSFASAGRRRVAGLPRFYQRVDVRSVNESNQDAVAKDDNVVQSPIAAGVDGTQSASGVHHVTNATQATAAYHLQPQPLRIRRPPEELTDDSSTTSTTKGALKSTSDITWYGVTLDDHWIQTPMGQKLMVPSALLAAQIAAEWEAVSDQIQPTQMPLMRLACTALDQTAHAMEDTRVQILNYVPTDTACYWADPTADENDRLLYQRQIEAWTHLHQRVRTVTGHDLGMASGTTEGMLLAVGAGGRRGVPHPPAVVDYATWFVQQLDAWHLTALHQLAVEGKSFWLAWDLLTRGGSLENDDDDEAALVSTSVQEAIHALRVEEEVQIETWGLVEGAQDYDRLNTNISVRAALLLREALALEQLHLDRRSPNARMDGYVE